MASSNWNGGSGGWGTIANWSGGVPNNAAADAQIAAGGSYVVTVETGDTYTIDSVVINDGGALLDVAGTLDLAGTQALANIDSGTLELQGAIVGGLVDVNGNATLLADGGRLANNADIDAGYNANLDVNGFALTLSGTASAVRSYVYGGGTLDIAGVVDVGGLYLASGTEELVTGTAIDDVSNTRLDYDNGSAASILSIASTGTYDITNVNSQIDFNGAIGTFINSGLLEATENQTSYFNLEQNFTNASTGTISVNAGDDISLIYGQDSVAGTIEGSGDIYIGNRATVSLSGSVVLNAAYLTISDGNTQVYLGGNTTFANEFSEVNGADINLAGHVLTVSGSGALDGYLSGPGTVDITGTYVSGEYFSSGISELLTGTLYQQYNVELDDDEGVAPSVLSIAAGALYDMEVGNGNIYNGYNNGTGTGTIINAGVMENTEYGGYDAIYTDLINAGTGTLSALPFDEIYLYQGQNQLGGSVTGLGELYIGQGSHTTLESSLAMKIATFVISDGGTNLDLASNQSFAGEFIMQGGAVIYTQGHTFSLSGPAYLNNAYIAGPGAVDVTGFGDVSGLVLTEKGLLLDSGDLNQTGGFQIGNGGGDSGQFTVTTGGVFDMLNNNGIGVYGSGVISNDGLFEKTGDNGNSNIQPRFNNAATGTLDVAAGVMSLADGGNLGGTIMGAGQLNLTGGTFTLAAKAVVKVGVFAVDGGVLTEIGNHSITSVFEDVGNDLNLGGFNLTIGQGYLENADLSGPGALIVTGTDLLVNFQINDDARLIDSGTIEQQSNFGFGNSATDNTALSITAKGVYDLLDNGGIGFNSGLATVVNAGLFEKTSDDTQSYEQLSFTNTSQGRVDAAIGIIALEGGSPTCYSKLGGTLMGAGEIDLDTSDLLLSAKKISVAVLAINASPTLGNNIAFGGTFYLNGNDELNLNGYTLSLSGTDYLVGGLGGGTVTESGTGLVNLLDVEGGSALIDTGLMEQVNQLRFGYYYDGTQNTLAIATGGTYDLLNDSGIADYINGTASANIFVSGLLEKTGGAGISEVQPTVTNSGTVLAASGTIQLDNPVDAVAGTLTEGEWEVTGGGALLLETAAPITVDAADIVINGQNSEIYSGPSGGRALLGSLTSISAGGVLQLVNAGSPAAGLVDAGTLVVSGGTVTGVSVVSGGVSDVRSGGLAVSTTVFNGGTQDVFNGGKAKFAVVSSGGTEYVSSGGMAISTTVESLGSSKVFSGGVASAVTIAGGSFDLAAGGTATGFIDFTGTGGELIIESKTMPATVISGFVAGDTIDLSGVVYATGARVTVATAGVVSIIDSGATYSLNIAGATVGESDFTFGPGALLTKTGAAKPRMAFVTPVSAAAPAGVAASLLQAPSPVSSVRVAPALSSAAFAGGAAELLTMVANGGSQVMAVTLAAG